MRFFADLSRPSTIAVPAAVAAAGAGGVCGCGCVCGGGAADARSALKAENSYSYFLKNGAGERCVRDYCGGKLRDSRAI